LKSGFPDKNSVARPKTKHLSQKNFGLATPLIWVTKRGWVCSQLHKGSFRHQWPRHSEAGVSNWRLVG